MNKKVAFLSMDSLENFYTYDRLLIEPLKMLGWAAEEISWRNEKVNWADYNAVIVRSTWDYQNDAENPLHYRQPHHENDISTDHHQGKH